ncbi:hypothetical protein KUCAC02_031573 [Chaenocephalus aceratus]|nr:hypothetical protein KUCAC02_031573 [Chaenocephalus aceratus]
MLLMSFFSIDSIARAFGRSRVMLFLKKVLILFRVEKLLSAVGVVTRAFRRLTVCECLLQIVVTEELEQSNSTTASPEVVSVRDEGQSRLELCLVQWRGRLHSCAAGTGLLAGGGADEVFGEGTSLLCVTQYGSHTYEIMHKSRHNK